MLLMRSSCVLQVVHRVLASLVLAETESIASQPVSTSEIKEHIGFASSRGKGSLINNSTIRRPTGAARCIRFFVGDKDGVARRQTADLPVRVGRAMDVDRSTSCFRHKMMDNVPDILAKANYITLPD
jgi:hypothetical protein